MKALTLSKILDAKNAVLLGESGSGKTEVSVNAAIALASMGQRVSLIDMDSTKGLFRARDLSHELAEAGVHMTDAFIFQDSPLVPQGVTGALGDDEARCVFDVGGNAVGARMVGQFAELLMRQRTGYFYVINPLRPFSGSAEEIEESMERICAASGIEPAALKFIANPCLGTRTTVELILEGIEQVREVSRRLGPETVFAAASADLAEEVEVAAGIPVFPLTLYVKALYER